MSDASRAYNAYLLTLVAVAVWLLLGMLFLLQNYFYMSSSGREMDWTQQAPYRLSGYLAWGLLTLPLYRLANYLQERFSRSRLLLLHLLLAILIGFGHRIFSTMLEYFLASLVMGQGGSLLGMFSARTVALVGGTVDSAVTYLVLMLLFAGYTAYERARQQQQKIDRVRQQLTQSRLDALQSQLQPHFLFNTLNSVVALINSAPSKAELMVEQLARILRFSLDNATQNTVTLEQELAALKDYMAIEQARLGSRLQFLLEVDEACLAQRVPTLILQPVVENAVRHGIAPHDKPGTVRLAVSRGDGRLRIEVEDSGDGFTAGQNNGLGLDNTRARLNVLFGDAAKLQVQRSGLGGARIEMSLPALAGLE